MSKKRSVANFVIHNLGLGGRSYDPKALEKFTPEEQAKHLKTYQDSLGLDASSMPNPEVFDLLTKTRFRELRDFSAVAAIKGKLESPDTTVQANIKSVDEEFREALTITAEVATIDNIKIEMDNISKELRANVGSTYRPQDALDTLHKLKAEGIEAVSKQQSAEITTLTAKFDAPGFKEKLTKAFGFTEAQIDLFKKDTLAALADSHKKQIEEFEKAIKEPVTKMHAAAQQENDRVAYLATLYQHNAEMKKVIDDLYNKNNNDTNAQVDIASENDNISARLKGIDIYQLPILKTVTNRDIQVDKDNKTFLVTFPRRAWGPLSPLNREGKHYYNSAQDLMAQDILSLVGAVRATGANSINLNAQHPDHDTAMEIARKGFEQSRYVGFDEKKIKVTVNGKVMTVEELFKDAPQIKQNIDTNAATSAKERAESKQRPEPEKTKAVGEFRKAVTDGRQKVEAKEKAEAETRGMGAEDHDATQAATPST